MSGFRTPDGLSAIAAVHVRGADVDLISISAGKVRNQAGVLKTFFSSMAAVASPPSLVAYGNDPGPVDIHTGSVTVSVTGGAPPYTYAWARTDADADTWLIEDADGPTTTFTCTAADVGGHSAAFACTVEDSAGAEAVSNEVGCSARNLGGGA